jgi:hypothetical protein
MDALHLNRERPLKPCDLEQETVQFLVLVKKKRTRKGFLALNFQKSRNVDQGNKRLTRYMEFCLAWHGATWNDLMTFY